ncbi:MAG: glycosyltransferase family 2 protein [Desulfovibrio sp.]|jgi:Glycosyltransferases involved in cell wall biogenesis|nr:glycosyltransferase family 2 protein [Desulfovibrio sp.]
MPEESLKMHPAPLLALVVPCYNEQEILPATMQTLSRMLEECKDNEIIKNDSYVLYVDDGSRDQTWNLLEEKHINDKYCHAIKFAGNAGHQNAVWAGMAQARAWDADCIISLDADLQDDTRIIPQMVEEYCKGNDIVYGVRNNRETDTTFKRVTAHLFYAFMRWLNVSVIPDHADYRLVSRPVLDALEGYSEQNLFLRGLFPTIGFKSSKVFYKRLSRKAGESKYPLRKMLSFAWRGITSCSVAPLRVAGLMSLICMLLAFIMCIVSLFKYATGDTIQGWTSLIIVSLLLGGVQLFCLAVMGEYIAKIFTEVRHRPRYIIEKTL